jgi:retron-type reverse transcriptase
MGQGTEVNVKRMIEQVLNPRNIMRAYRQVVSNKGSAGVDGMSVKELYAYLTKNRTQIESDVRAGKYLPQPIRGKEIRKSSGKKRLLGIPTVIDRMLQQAVGKVLAIKFEMDFEDYSYGLFTTLLFSKVFMSSLRSVPAQSQRTTSGTQSAGVYQCRLPSHCGH